jgi:Domain of unknown function (DUF222)/HNH endonuclease
VFASDPAELVRNGLATLASEDRRSWSAAAHSERLLELRELQERLDAEMVRCVADWDAAAAWAEGTALGPKSWLASRARMTRPEADRLLKSARLVRDHEATARALAGGAVSARHVEALAVAAHQRADLYAEYEVQLLEAAGTVDAQDFPTFARRWRELVDDDRSARDAGFAFERRGFTLSPTTGGSVVSGFLDAEASAIVSRGLEALQPPDPIHGAEPPRSRAQRFANALVLMAERSHGGTLPESRPLAGADIVVDHKVLARHPLVELDGLRCDIEGFGPITRVTAERLTCDCALSRVVMRGRSEIVDYGRRTRVIPRRLRRLVQVRDEHCQFPGCREPAQWCDVHHLRHWLDGGETNLDNLALLCRRHHVACHEGGWKLARGPDGLALAA